MTGSLRDGTYYTIGGNIVSNLYNSHKSGVFSLDDRLHKGDDPLAWFKGPPKTVPEIY